MAWSYDEARAFLAARIAPGARAGERRDGAVARMRALCAALGDPQRAYPAIHVTGTNGKGSVTRLVSGLLAEEGLVVGTCTSPDLGRPNERMAVGLDPVDDAGFARVVEKVAGADRATGAGATYVELLQAAAFAWFAERAVDVAVVEVLRGGRRDATNVVDAVVVAVTNVGTDHAEVIGPTRADIAYEKAGVVKRGTTRVLVLGETDHQLAAVFERERPAQTWRRGREFSCPRNELAPGAGRLLDLVTPAASYEAVRLSLHGPHQGDNASVALAAAEAFVGRAIGDTEVRRAFGRATHAGRFEVVRASPLVVLDGAHDAGAARAAAATLSEIAPGAPVVLVVGMLEPHDPAEMLGALGAARARAVVATAPESVRAVPADLVAAAARSLGAEVVAVGPVDAAVARAVALAGSEGAVLVTGSLYIVSEARRAAPYDDRP
ncbi:MAG TPA: Mur ligase family protein [Acidimicrobiales bacterium]